MAKQKNNNSNNSNNSVTTLTMAKVLFSVMSLAARPCNVGGVTVDATQCRNKRALSIALYNALVATYPVKGMSIAKALSCTPLTGLGFTSKDGGKGLAAGINDARGYIKPQASWFSATQPAGIEACTGAYKEYAQSVVKAVQSLQGDGDEAKAFSEVQSLCRKLIGITPDDKGHYTV
jgi:hypothetical protein